MYRIVDDMYAFLYVSDFSKIQPVKPGKMGNSGNSDNGRLFQTSLLRSEIR